MVVFGKGCDYPQPRVATPTHHKESLKTVPNKSCLTNYDPMSRKDIFSKVIQVYDALKPCKIFYHFSGFLH